MLTKDEIKIHGKGSPTKLGWGEMKTDVVIESASVFTSMEKLKLHIQGAKEMNIYTALQRYGSYSSSWVNDSV